MAENKMKTICLLSCCKEKLSYGAPAEKLYQSDKFKCRLAYARLLNPDSIFVISALHHIVPLDKVAVAGFLQDFVDSDLDCL